MNKKLGLFAIPLLMFSAFGLSSCGEKANVELVFGDKTASDFRYLNFTQLEEKVNSKETFLLVVQYSDGCACWVQEAKPTLIKYIKEKHVICYHIKNDELVKGNNNFGIKILTGSVSFAVFEDGEVRNCINTHDSKTLKNYDSFVEYMDSFVNMPHFFWVSKEEVSRLYDANSKSVVFYSRSTCGDCSYVNSNYLVEFSKKHPEYSKEVYVLECDVPGIRYNDEGVLDADKWGEFKTEHELSYEGNFIYGYETGVVPTFQLIGNGQLYSQCVYFNDSVTKTDDNKFVVSNSYYTNERLEHLQYLKDFDGTKVLKGLEVSKDDVEEHWSKDGQTFYGYGWLKKKAAKYHDPILEQFLLYSEKQ